jgi:hypothetical protein
MKDEFGWSDSSFILHRSSYILFFWRRRMIEPSGHSFHSFQVAIGFIGGMRGTFSLVRAKGYPWTR